MSPNIFCINCFLSSFFCVRCGAVLVVVVERGKGEGVGLGLNFNAKKGKNRG